MWIVSVSGGKPEQLSFHESNDDLACCSPDFKRLVELNLQNANAM
jgi:Tol biopolymer transport system component